MAVLKQKSKKPLSKRSAVSKQGKTAKKVTTGKKLATPVKKSVVKASTSVLQPKKQVIPLAPKPTAQTCPLVLDGIILGEDFSPRECFSCDEFDCRFYAAEERSGPLGSRLFVGGEDDEEGDEWGLSDDDGEDPGEADDWGDTDDE
jgi:hypothetical protein